jgi:hypothetical protein
VADEKLGVRSALVEFERLDKLMTIFAVEFHFDDRTPTCAPPFDGRAGKLPTIPHAVLGDLSHSDRTQRHANRDGVDPLFATWADHVCALGSGATDRAIQLRQIQG